jgi:hypothetical protein
VGSAQDALSPAKALQRKALTDKTQQINLPQAPGKLLKAARHVPTEDMDAFKLAVVGEEMTKVAMVEHLKKMFVP